ncbi:type VII secretion-associated serine protease mycosin [Nocardia sp. NEAU-G5]|uniref:Type VII secretion-associated serine protease mycosin n=1 Tax=Nocardia albiluteola TaxID=2842303 RepID=A0ABS6B4H2_9NOCA|nr:type VII secretion-associated serine protease mycosin [Nocardia albiluteola]MBU3065209.1 type VII secretion-associated serine protease mycosin [Nocardia albiluteola]
MPSAATSRPGERRAPKTSAGYTHRLGATAVALILAFGPAHTARAVTPPGVNPGALVIGAPVAPPERTQQHLVCSHPVWTGPPPTTEPLAQQALGLTRAWEFSRGAGQLVAVIDTGVNDHPRLTVVPGGDYVSTSPGTVDCDGHGTLVAGIIAGHPAPDGGDRFSGVAPDATILSIRQTSLAYEAKDSYADDRRGRMSAGGYGTVTTLAYAVVHAVELHASVINISEVSCIAATDAPADGVLGAALKYAADHNVVVVAAAGNLESQGACKDQNGTSSWDSVKTVASPAWFSPYVLSVASVEADGSPSSFTLYGPWVGVAAPGSNLMSLDSTPGGTGLVNGTPQADGRIAPVDGTSFASAFVAGVAALVRARFPGLTAAQVIGRIERTAHGPGRGRDDRIGAGLVDPVAALTAVLPPAGPVDTDVSRPIPAPQPPARIDPGPRRIAVDGALTCLTLLGIVLAVSIPFRREHRRRLVLPGDDE